MALKKTKYEKPTAVIVDGEEAEKLKKELKAMYPEDPEVQAIGRKIPS